MRLLISWKYWSKDLLAFCRIAVSFIFTSVGEAGSFLRSKTPYCMFKDSRSFKEGGSGPFLAPPVRLKVLGSAPVSFSFALRAGIRASLVSKSRFTRMVEAPGDYRLVLALSLSILSTLRERRRHALLVLIRSRTPQRGNRAGIGPGRGFGDLRWPLTMSRQDLVYSPCRSVIARRCLDGSIV